MDEFIDKVIGFIGFLFLLFICLLFSKI